jgi:hypothetical protein
MQGRGFVDVYSNVNVDDGHLDRNVSLLLLLWLFSHVQDVMAKRHAGSGMSMTCRDQQATHKHNTNKGDKAEETTTQVN